MRRRSPLCAAVMLLNSAQDHPFSLGMHVCPSVAWRPNRFNPPNSPSRRKCGLGEDHHLQVSGGSAGVRGDPLLWRAQNSTITGCPRSDRDGRSDARHAHDPVLEIRHLLHDVQPRSRRPQVRAGLRHDSLPPAGRGKIIDVCKKEIGLRRRCRPTAISRGSRSSAWRLLQCADVQINNDFYEDLTERNFASLLNDMRAGKPVKIGSQIGRKSSEPCDRPADAAGQRAL